MAELQKTRQRIVEALKRNGGATVDQLASHMGLVPVTVRAHLAILERDGLVFGEEERTGGAGRPHILYQLTEKGEELFPRHYDRLANNLLDHLVATQGADRVIGMLESIAINVASEHEGRLASKPFDERVREAAAILTQQGCTAEYSESGGAYQVDIYNCPYRKVASEHPQVCTLETQLLKTLTRGRVLETVNTSPRGAICSYQVLPTENGVNSGN